MGSSNNSVRAIVGAAAGVGLILLIGSALFLDDWRKAYDICRDVKDFLGDFYDLIPDDLDEILCQKPTFYLVGASVGLIAALLQIGSSILGFIGKGRAWAIIQIFVFVLLIIAFAVPVSKEAFDIESSPELQLSHPALPGISVDYPAIHKGRAMFFLIMCIIDAIVALGTAGAVFMLDK